MASNIKVILSSTILGAVAGAAAAWGVTNYMNTQPVIAVANVQEIVAASPKVQALQNEQKDKVQNLASFVNNANEEIAKVNNDKDKKELEDKYMAELTLKKAEFERDYINKLSQISEELSQMVNTKAADKGYTLVLSKDAVVSGADDITAELIEIIK